MDKDHVFKSSDFYMAENDVLHLIFIDETGSTPVIGLYGNSGDDTEDETEQEAITGENLVDLDGNVYTTVVIGNQEWIVENFRCEYYADGTPIPVIELGSTTPYSPTWNNTSFDTFTDSGLNITSAIADASGYSAVVLSDYSTQAETTIKVTVTVTNFTLNSGSAPYIWIGSENGGTTGDLYDVLADGTFTATLVSGTANIVPVIQLTNYDDEDPSAVQFATNFSADFAVTLSAWEVDTVGAMCYYNNDSATYKADYGALYNWYAVNNEAGLAYLERGGVQEVGWRVATQADLLDLRELYGGYLYAGTHFKESGTTRWSAPNPSADNSSGLTTVGNGTRTSATGAFGSFGTIGYIWTSSEISSLLAMSFLTYSNYTLDPADASRAFIGSANKKAGMAVRLVRDI